MRTKIKNEGKKILIYRAILSTDEYRKLSGLSPGEENTLASLKQQLEDPPGPGKDFWWSPVTDLEFLKVKAVNNPVRTALVTDGNAAIICELPGSIQRKMIIEVD